MPSDELIRDYEHIAVHPEVYGVDRTEEARRILVRQYLNENHLRPGLKKAAS